METVTAKWTAVIIAKGDKTRMYGSVAEVPTELRRQLEDSLQREDAATIVIADESGRRELIRAFQGETPDLQSGLRRLRQQSAKLEALSSWPVRRIVAGAVVALAVAASILIAIR